MVCVVNTDGVSVVNKKTIHLSHAVRLIGPGCSLLKAAAGSASF